MLTPNQKLDYDRDGYLLLRDFFTTEEMQRLDTAFAANPPLDGNNAPDQYPAPDRYTFAKSSWQDPAFAHFAEHEGIVGGARQLLDDDVYLTAYVLYDRTPGGHGLPPHHDYKRWRPVGSSMNWLFTIVPMCDFDDETGVLQIAPGSHRLERVVDRHEGAMHVNPAVTPKADDFINPQLKRGDLLFMNMHLWHKAGDNKSNLHRTGLFNKYAARHCPPATGYYLYTDDVYSALSDQGKSLLAVHSDKKIKSTRLLLHRKLGDDNQFFFRRVDDQLELPGGPVYAEKAIPDWDEGNYIDAVQAHTRDQVRIETPWVSYIGDYSEADGLCRVYGYPMNWNGFPAPYTEGQWLGEAEIATADLRFGYEADSIRQWLDPTIIRGKGISQAKARIDQFAY
jgi:hypothetical protein